LALASANLPSLGRVFWHQDAAEGGRFTLPDFVDLRQ
jgi:hypothetical protein